MFHNHACFKMWLQGSPSEEQQEPKGNRATVLLLVVLKDPYEKENCSRPVPSHCHIRKRFYNMRCNCLKNDTNTHYKESGHAGFLQKGTNRVFNEEARVK